MVSSDATIVEVDGVADGEGPEGFINLGGPIGHGVKEDGARGALDCADSAFSDAILPVRTNGTESEVLEVCVTGDFESCGRVDAIVSSDVVDANVVFSGESFEFAFGFDKFDSIFGFMHGNIDK